jgi:plastocyanin
MQRHHDRKPRLALALTAGLFALTALNAAPLPARSIAVRLGDYRFTPDSLSVKDGETVQLELTNTDKLTPHNFTLKAETAGLDVDVDVSPGQTETVDITPLAPGTYTFYCNKKLIFFKSHRDRGMEGTLVVTPAGSD